MFTKTLLNTALLAVLSSAQQDSQTEEAPTSEATTLETLSLGKVPDDLKDSLYPEMAIYFNDGGEYADYTWEAHRLETADGYMKTLFRVTGSTKHPGFKPKRQPVLFVNGSISNAMSFFKLTFSEYDYLTRG